MNFSLVFEAVSPLWLLPCLLLGVLYAWTLYRNSSIFTPTQQKYLFVLRSITVALIAFLLLTPLIRMLTKQVEKPILIIAQDNSESILLGNDSVFYKNDYPQKLKNISSQFGEEYEVRFISFGSEIVEGFDETYSQQQTDISKLFNELSNRFANRNVGAVILASDGIYNRGINPIYTIDKLSAPIFTIGLGDTIPRRDLLISGLEFNRIVYLENDFRVNVSVAARGFAGSRTKLTVQDATQVVFTQDINLNSSDFRIDIPVQLQANKVGTQRYTVSLQALEGEITTKNNQQIFFVDVLDGKQKVMLLAAAPHPDLAAIKQSIESNRNYEVEIVLLEDADLSKLSSYGLLILHQLPNANAKSGLLSQSIQALSLPVWYIIGNQTEYNSFNALQNAITVQNFSGSFNESQGVLRNDFYLFTLSEESKNRLRDFPPLNSPFLNATIKGQSAVLFNQLIGVVQTDRPLWAFTDIGGIKYGITYGEGLWKWRLHNFKASENHEAFDELITKTVQYLASKEDKRKFRVNANKKFFDENENITFVAEVYNDSYEPITQSEVTIELKNSNGASYPFAFNKADKNYTLNAGLLPVGDYTYTAKSILGTTESSVSGQFVINPLNVEELQTTADHALLFAIAERSGGQFLLPAQMDNLLDLIKNNEEITSTSFEEKRYEDIINLKFLFFLLLALLSAEWFIRKRSGVY